jgi:hypothetical protein
MSSHSSTPADGRTGRRLGTARDFAYACFLPPAVLAVGLALVDTLPMSFTSRQGYAMLLGLPLAMVSMGAIPVGLALAAYLRRDWALPVLAAATIAAVAVFVSDTSGRTATNVLAFAYGALVLALDGLWFLRRRWAFTGDDGARAAALSTR